MSAQPDNDVKKKRSAAAAELRLFADMIEKGGVHAIAISMLARCSDPADAELECWDADE